MARRIHVAVVALALLVHPPSLRAQEFNGYFGKMYEVTTGGGSYAWQVEYTEGISEHFRFSWSWLNEGHVPGHHRDGHTLQFWARTPLFTRQLSVALGTGGYRLFDTGSDSLTGYTDHHGWGLILSTAASYYLRNRVVLHAKVNRIWASEKDISTWTALLGIGYQLQAPDTPGPRVRPVPQIDYTTNNELTVFLGRTVVNSFESERGVATSLEYRRGVARYFDWTASYINEGDPQVIRRNGLATQLWATRAFFGQKLTFGVGGGIYLAVDQKFNPDSTGGGSGTVSGLVTPTASYRPSEHIVARFNWNRTVTTYNKDTDLFLLGIGWRF
jgi:hypothetical protein